jgi:hypothetical protein
VLPECQLLTEGRLFNFEDIFVALLFLSPEAQGRLLFDALFGFIPDF